MSEGSERVSYARRMATLAATDGSRVALRVVGPGGDQRSLTWRELDRRSTQVAHGLRRRGLGRGDRASLALRNSPELVLAVLGAWKVGATPVPVRWDLPAWERQRVLDVVAGAVHLGEDDLEWVQKTEADEPTRRLPEVVAPVTHGICSSGSTGLPKVILADRPGEWDPTVGQPFPTAWIEVPRPQRVLVPGPMYHTNGFNPFYNLLAGDDLVVLERFDARLILDLIESLEVTTFTATPTMLQRIADVPGVDDRDLSSIVWVLQGAASMPATLVHRWIGLLGAERFFLSYGMTEGLGLACLRADEWLERPGSVGRGYRGTEIRIKDVDGTLLVPGEVGEIWLRSPTSGLYRYLGGGTGSLPTDADGFSTAGDMGFVDEDGFLTIIDRRVDLIVTGGANVFPAEVENALVDHPGIADVVVVGLKDETWGRRVHAIVQPADPSAPPDEADVIAFAKGRLAAYKVPKSVELVEAIPRSEATKVNRGALVDARGG